MGCDWLRALWGPARHTTVPEELGTLGRSRKQHTWPFSVGSGRGMKKPLTLPRLLRFPPPTVNKPGGLKDLAHERGRETYCYQVPFLPLKQLGFYRGVTVLIFFWRGGGLVLFFDNFFNLTFLVH